MGRLLIGVVTCGQGMQPAQGDPERDSWETKYPNISPTPHSTACQGSPLAKANRKLEGEGLNGCSPTGPLPAQGGVEKSRQWVSRGERQVSSAAALPPVPRSSTGSAPLRP